MPFRPPRLLRWIEGLARVGALALTLLVIGLVVSAYRPEVIATARRLLSDGLFRGLLPAGPGVPDLDSEPSIPTSDTPEVGPASAGRQGASAAGSQKADPVEAARAAVAAYAARFPEATFGVYYKELKSGRSFGVNEDARIEAASLIKVPVVLYLYEQIAQGRMKWTDRVTYRAETDYQDGAGILRYWAEDGLSYSLRALATISMVLSDNIAHSMLVRHLGYDNLVNYMKRLGASVTSHTGGSGLTTARDMGRFMEAAYRFSEREPELGGRLLDDLAHTIFHVGIPGKLPAHLVIPHKEGTVSGVNSDMGIVPGPRGPYVLVVLTKGFEDEEEGFEHVAEVSRLVWEAVGGADT